MARIYNALLLLYTDDDFALHGYDNRDIFENFKA